jgi:hypothetical protein
MEYEMLKEEVIDFIEDNREKEDAEFFQMASKVFAFQYKSNSTYRKYCRNKRVSPRTVKQLQDIPVVPIQAFKEVDLACFRAEEAEAVFMTSGTTNLTKRGTNIHKSLHIWKRSMLCNFQQGMMAGKRNMRMIVLFPNIKEMPNSSLATYLDLAVEHFGTADSEYVVSQNKFDILRFLEIVRKAEEKGEALFILGATFSFIQFIDYCHEHGISFGLPSGGIVMHTGGSKGKTREMGVEEFTTEICTLFNLSKTQCRNMYGMTELSSQFYNFEKASDFIPPHWVKTFVVDPETLQPVNKGDKGLLIHYDLANVHSVFGILTEDVGIETDKGFRLLGRIEGAEAKGCSLAVEELTTVGKSG